MKKIELTPSELISQGAEMAAIKEDYETLFQSVSQILNVVNQNWSASLSNNFEGKILAAQNSFSSINHMLQIGSNAAVNSAAGFLTLDSQLAGVFLGIEKNTSKTGVTGTEEKNTSEDVANALEMYSDWLDAAGKLTDKDEYGCAGSVLSFINATSETTQKLLKGEMDMETYLKFLKESLGLTGDLADNSSIGILSKIAGVFSAEYKAVKSGDVGTFLQESDGVIEAAGKLGIGIGKQLELVESGVKGIKEANSVLTSVTTMATMGTHLVGDVIAYSKDGEMSAQDWADTSINTGVAGGTSLIKGLTFGLVDIDGDKAVSTYKNNTDAVSDYLSTSGLPLEAQCAAGVLASPAVFLVSTAEIAADTLGKTVNTVIGGFEAVGDGINWVMKNTVKGLQNN